MLTDRHLGGLGKPVLSVPSVMCGLVLVTLEEAAVVPGLPSGDAQGQFRSLLGAGFPAGSVILFLSTPFCFRKAVGFGSGEIAFCFPKAVISQGEQLQCVTKGEVPASTALPLISTQMHS